MSENIAQRLQKMGIELPQPPQPVASYVGYVIEGNLVYVSGQVPLADGKIVQTGLLGDTVSLEQGVAAAQTCAINILAQVKAACGGDLERINRCIRLGGFVASTPDFFDHPKVINGASDFMAQALGDRGTHCRAAVGVAALPLNSSVEVEALFSIT